SLRLPTLRLRLALQLAGLTLVLSRLITSLKLAHIDLLIEAEGARSLSLATSPPGLAHLEVEGHFFLLVSPGILQSHLIRQTHLCRLPFPPSLLDIIPSDVVAFIVPGPLLLPAGETLALPLVAAVRAHGWLRAKAPGNFYGNLVGNPNCVLAHCRDQGVRAGLGVHQLLVVGKVEDGVDDGHFARSYCLS
ncbi:hypothetical protein IWX46DRAFT_659869, partial [Phyllosticta citricarpa]